MQILLNCFRLRRSPQFYQNFCSHSKCNSPQVPNGKPAPDVGGWVQNQNGFFTWKSSAPASTQAPTEGPVQPQNVKPPVIPQFVIPNFIPQFHQSTSFFPTLLQPVLPVQPQVISSSTPSPVSTNPPLNLTKTNSIDETESKTSR